MRERPQHEQKTPQGETIPVPTDADVLRDLRKVAKAHPPMESDESDAPSSGAEQE